jgi:hypothetical protein
MHVNYVPQFEIAAYATTKARAQYCNGAAEFDNTDA